ncbi:MAG: hypothetical protein Kow0042_09820 [Calditrichia bacterium]
MRIIPNVMKNILLLTFIFCMGLFSNIRYAQSQTIEIPDSLLEKFTIEELIRLKKMLEEERARLIQKQEEDRQRGVELSKTFLNQTREENENQDMILIRVAEYYIEEAQEDHDQAVLEYNRQYEEYERQLEAYQAGQLKVEPIQPQFPKKNYERAISIYDLILINFPESELADDALYNKAYLLADMDEEKAAQQTYLELIDKYPESEYIPEAYLRLAEYYFQPRLGQSREETIRNLNKAAQLYKNVLNYKTSPRYDEALYKLGWTYYRLAAADPQYYRDAILYFTMVVRDVEKFQELDPEGEYIKANIQPEALQYIAASFVDTSYTKDGVQKLTNFLTRLDYPPYGVDILTHMGDIYARIVEYDNAVRAYRSLLELYPDYKFAPRIHKKIADVFLEARQYEQAYAERQILFENYNPKSEWYANQELQDIPDKIVVLDEANRLSEEALRSNIIYQLELAREYEKSGGDSLSAYQEFAKLASSYLETFPTHENAYEINWSLAYILDTELKNYEKAFEEYIRVSNDYLESIHREDAAVNAIVVAQTLVNMERTREDTTQISGVDLSQMTAQDFTDREKMLAEAFDNYIKLFPNEEKTASYLASAGALYYQHRQYDLARKYYKTMVTKFPEAQQRSVGLLSLMNSYFFLGKYRDAEFVAKKIMESEGLPPDQIEVARKRSGESIYKNAEKLEQEEQFLSAAQEYYRVFTDAPFYKEIVDVALFNSGRNYEKAGEWQQAISVYDTLVTNFPESEYRLVALGRIADAYKQVEDFANVGKTYERIYQLNPQGSDAEAALYNASLFFAKANAFRDAIRVNDLFIQKFPDNPDAKDLLFENAQYYLKLDDLDSANRIYRDFAQRYPNDKRTIEAYYRRGEYYFENGQYDLAKQEFQNSIARSEEFARTGQDPNLLYASEAYFKLGEIEYNEFKNIKLTYPESTFRTRLEQKKAGLLSVVNAFTKVISMGSLKGFEAMYKVAEAYEEFANSLADQELPPNLTPEQELVERDRVFKMAVPAYDRAVEEYKNVIKNIPVYAQKLEVSLFDTTREVEETLPFPEDTLLVIEKETFQDSTREIALKWYNRAEEKISLILYTVAERSEEFIDAYLRQENPATGIVYLSWKKLLLERGVAPAVNVTLNAHLKNINISDQLNLDNKYVRESERKILLTSNILGEEYGKLVKKAIEIYESDIPVLKELLEGGESATTPDGLNYLDVNDRMLTVIDYMNEFQTIALNQYENTLRFARENKIENDAVLTTQDRLFNFAYESGTRVMDLSRKAQEERDYYTNLLNESGDVKYQVAPILFDDQQSILKDYAKQTLELSYQVSKDYDIKNVWTNLILAKLVELEPAQYLGDLPKEKTIVTTDLDWLSSKEFALGWIDPEFDDSNWQKVSAVELPFGLFFPVFDSLQINPIAIWVYQPPADTHQVVPPVTQPRDSLMQPDTSSISDTTARPRSLELEDKEPMEEFFTTTPVSSDTTQFSLAPLEEDTLRAFFRKHFTLENRAISGWAVITADDEYLLYLNGEYIKGDNVRIYEQVDKLEFIEFGDFLRVGENVIAVDVTDVDGPPRYGFRFYMEIESLPVEITSAAEKIRQRAERSVDEDRLKTVIILNKNRILSQ